jgi:hypothetical protein
LSGQKLNFRTITLSYSNTLEALYLSEANIRYFAFMYDIKCLQIQAEDGSNKWHIKVNLQHCRFPRSRTA